MHFPFNSCHPRNPILTASQQSSLSQSRRNRSSKKMEATRIKLTCAVHVEGGILMENSGLAVTFARSGTMVTVSASHLRRQTTSSSTSAPLAATRGAESEHGSLSPLANVVRIAIRLGRVGVSCCFGSTWATSRFHFTGRSRCYSCLGVFFSRLVAAAAL